MFVCGWYHEKCRLMGGVPLQKVSVSRGLTVVMGKLTKELSI